jgi:hypothetical protein
MKTKYLIALLAAIGFTSQAAVSARVGLEWTYSVGDTGDHTYRVYRGVASGTPTEQFNAGSTNQFWMDDLVPGTPYFFTVTALRDGLESLPSNEVNYTAPTGQPVTVVVNATFQRDASKVLVQWTANPTNQLVFQYEIGYKPTNVVDYASVMVTTNSATIPVDATSTYNFRVRAIGPAGVGPWFDRVVPALPGPPIFLLVRANGGVQYIYKQ